ncbi:MAG: hypothetical protein ABIG64_07300 [Candidatus Omnitrophota bacterium]
MGTKISSCGNSKTQKNMLYFNTFYNHKLNTKIMERKTNIFLIIMMLFQALLGVTISFAEITTTLSPHISMPTRSLQQAFIDAANPGDIRASSGSLDSRQRQIITQLEQKHLLQEQINSFHSELMKMDNSALSYQLQLAHRLFDAYLEEAETKVGKESSDNIDVQWAWFLRQTMLQNTTNALADVIENKLIPLLHNSATIKSARLTELELLQQKLTPYELFILKNTDSAFRNLNHTALQTKALDRLKEFEQISKNLTPYEQLLFYFACGAIRKTRQGFNISNGITAEYFLPANKNQLNKSRYFLNDSGIFHAFADHTHYPIIEIDCGAGFYPKHLKDSVGKGTSLYCLMKELEILLINTPDISGFSIPKQSITHHLALRSFYFFYFKAQFRKFHSSEYGKYEGTSNTAKNIISRFEAGVPVSTAEIDQLLSINGLGRNLIEEEQHYWQQVNDDHSERTNPLPSPQGSQITTNITISLPDYALSVQDKEKLKRAQRLELKKSLDAAEYGRQHRGPKAMPRKKIKKKDRQSKEDRNLEYGIVLMLKAGYEFKLIKQALGLIDRYNNNFRFYSMFGASTDLYSDSQLKKQINRDKNKMFKKAGNPLPDYKKWIPTKQTLERDEVWNQLPKFIKIAIEKGPEYLHLFQFIDTEYFEDKKITFYDWDKMSWIEKIEISGRRKGRQTLDHTSLARILSYVTTKTSKNKEEIYDLVYTFSLKELRDLFLYMYFLNLQDNLNLESFWVNRDSDHFI